MSTLQASAQTIPLKRERSPTPPLTLQPRTSGVKLVAPLPQSCKRMNPDYQKARKLWVQEEIKTLNALGLYVRKKFVRDDGLSLEWESPVPVWPDSLKPANLPSSPSIAPPMRVDEDMDMRIDLVPAQSISSQDIDRGADNSVPVEQDIEPSTQDTPEDADLERQATELEDLAVEFLKKYVQAFDTDRTHLSHAYASNALFSYTVHECSSIGGIPRYSVAAAFTNPSTVFVHRFAPRKGSRNLHLLHSKTTPLGAVPSSSNLHSGPSEIVKALQSLGPQFKFCKRSPTDLKWNVLAFRLDQTSKGNGRQDKSNAVSAVESVDQVGEDSNRKQDSLLVYLSTYGELTEERGVGPGSGSGKRRLSFDQCFILQRPQRTAQTVPPHGIEGSANDTRSEGFKGAAGTGRKLRDTFSETNLQEVAEANLPEETDEWPLVAINHQLTVRDLSIPVMVPLTL